MFPELFEIPRLFTIPEVFGVGPFDVGPLTVYTYGVLLAASYLLGLRFAMARARQRGLDSARVLDLGVYIIIAALIGAKALLLVTEPELFSGSWNDVLTIARSGGVFYGGLIAAVLAGFWYIARHRMPFWTTCDIFAPAIALGHVTGRLGCFAAGCCYGRPADVPWAVVFTNPLAEINAGTPLGIPLHPTQIYEAGAALAILGVLVATERRGRTFAGRTFWLYMLIYAVARFLIEIYRGDPRGVVFDVLSTSQFISVVLAPLSLAMLVWLSRAPAEAGVRPAHAAARGRRGRANRSETP